MPPCVVIAARCVRSPPALLLFASAAPPLVAARRVPPRWGLHGRCPLLCAGCVGWRAPSAPFSLPAGAYFTQISTHTRAVCFFFCSVLLVCRRSLRRNTTKNGPQSRAVNLQCSKFENLHKKGPLFLRAHFVTLKQEKEVMPHRVRLLGR